MALRHSLTYLEVLGSRRIRREAVDGLDESVTQPLRRTVTADVDGEVVHSRVHLGITVMPEIVRPGVVGHGGDCRRSYTEPMSATAVDLVLFDLDGTLTDSAPGILAGFDHALATVGTPPVGADVHAHVVGPPMIDTFRSLGLSEDQVERAREAYTEYYDRQGWAENSVYEGVVEVLEALRAAGVPMAVATSKNERFARRILEHFDLAKYFEFIAGASDDGSRRAKSDVVARALEQVGRTARETAAGGTGSVVMVGDRDHDVFGAGHWGIPVVLVAWGYGQAGEHAAATWSVESAADLTALLASLTSSAA